MNSNQASLLSRRVGYLKYGSHATNLISQLSYRLSGGDTDRETYRYDADGRVCAIRENGRLKVKYTYDALGRLVREDNRELALTTTFEYDCGGNLLRQNEYPYSLADADALTDGREMVYTYGVPGRPDLLTEFDGQTIAYDDNGCPSTYLGNDCSYTRGTLLASFTDNSKDDPVTTCFAYDADGLRTRKNETVFTYLDGKLLCQRSNIEQIDFIYGASGMIGVTRLNKTYLFRRNLFGDVTHIYTTEGVLCAKYLYDAWGNHTVVDAAGAEILDSDHIGNVNPIRYRGYYYDTETGLYYLQARYYDPKTGRFLSQDHISYLDPKHLTGLNLFAYCNNNPVMYADPSGHFPILATILGGLALAGLITTGIGVATDTNLVTAIGLTAVAIPALISGGLAVFATTGTLATIVGVGTIVAGAGSGLFASAEYQETFTGQNWMLNAGMSEGWYNGLMIATASLATLGTFASSFAYSFNINSIQKVGNLQGTDYKGIRFTQKVTRTGGRKTKITKTLEWHTHSHKGYNPHWQVNVFSYHNGTWHRGVAEKYWTWWLQRII